MVPTYSSGFAGSNADGGMPPHGQQAQYMPVGAYSAQTGVVPQPSSAAPQFQRQHQAGLRRDFTQGNTESITNSVQLPRRQQSRSPVRAGRTLSPVVYSTVPVGGSTAVQPVPSRAFAVEVVSSNSQAETTGASSRYYSTPTRARGYTPPRPHSRAGSSITDTAGAAVAAAHAAAEAAAHAVSQGSAPLPQQQQQQQQLPQQQQQQPPQPQRSGHSVNLPAGIAAEPANQSAPSSVKLQQGVIQTYAQAVPNGTSIATPLPVAVPVGLPVATPVPVPTTSMPASSSAEHAPQQPSTVAQMPAAVTTTPIQPLNAAAPSQFAPLPQGCYAQDVSSGTPTPLVIALDVDEVLACYVDGFRKFLLRERPNGPLDTTSVFHEAHNPTSPWRLQFALNGGLDNLEAVPGAVAATETLRAAGVRLEAVTSRPPIMRQSTEALLLKLFPPDTFAAAHFVGPGEKGMTCNAIRARALVDDQMPNVVDAASCGVLAILFDLDGAYPWSRCDPQTLPPNAARFETWAATCNYLFETLRIPWPGQSKYHMPASSRTSACPTPAWQPTPGVSVSAQAGAEVPSTGVCQAMQQGFGTPERKVHQQQFQHQQHPTLGYTQTEEGYTIPGADSTPLGCNGGLASRYSPESAHSGGRVEVASAPTSSLPRTWIHQQPSHGFWSERQQQPPIQQYDASSVARYPPYASPGTGVDYRTQSGWMSDVSAPLYLPHAHARGRPPDDDEAGICVAS